MEANIITGVYVRVGGNAGKTNGLAWHIVENMFGHLQQLIELLAKYELQTDIAPNLKEFEIEIFDFKPGSAVPAFRLVQKPQSELIATSETQKIEVANRFDQLMSFANKGQYEAFFNEEGLPEVRYEIGEELYGFTLSADNSPISLVKPPLNGVYKEIYNVPQFNQYQAEYLLRPKIRRKKAEEPEQLLALVQRVGKRRKILDMYENKDTQLSIAPTRIVTLEKVYHLHSPLVCTINKEDGNYIIENDMLDIYAAGKTIDEAEIDFYNEFDAAYQLFSSIPDDQLSGRLLRAKIMMTSYIKEITTE